MKAILEFELPDDDENFQMAVNALRYRVMVENIRCNVRSMWKHGQYSDEQWKVIDEIYSMICQEANMNEDSW
jgi:hypothetical protein